MKQDFGLDQLDFVLLSILWAYAMGSVALQLDMGDVTSVDEAAFMAFWEYFLLGMAALAVLAALVAVLREIRLTLLKYYILNNHARVGAHTLSLKEQILSRRKSVSSAMDEEPDDNGDDSVAVLDLFKPGGFNFVFKRSQSAAERDVVQLLLEARAAAICSCRCPVVRACLLVPATPSGTR